MSKPSIKEEIVKVVKSEKSLPLAKLRKILREKGFTDGQIAGAVRKLREGSGVYSKVLESVLIEGEGKDTKFSYRLIESNFYEPLGNFLKDKLNLATYKTNVPAFKDLNIPIVDIIGITRSKISNNINIPSYVISVEVKTSFSPNDVYKGLGQCLFYKMFSNCVFLAVPEDVINDYLL